MLYLVVLLERHKGGSTIRVEDVVIGVELNRLFEQIDSAPTWSLADGVVRQGCGGDCRWEGNGWVAEERQCRKGGRGLGALVVLLIETLDGALLALKRLPLPGHLLSNRVHHRLQLLRTKDMA